MVRILTILISVAVSAATGLSAQPYPEVTLDSLLTAEQKAGVGLQKLSPEEREALRVAFIEVYLRGFQAGQREGAKTTAEEPTSRKGAAGVIESRIDGEFEGWDGETVIKLMNGQIWKQTEYWYHYHYSYMPSVVIYQEGGSYKMKVDGIDKAVRVRQLN